MIEKVSDTKLKKTTERVEYIEKDLLLQDKKTIEMYIEQLKEKLKDINTKLELFKK